MQPYESLLHARAMADERLMVLTAENRAAIRNLPPLLGDRFVDTGITEQTMIGMSAGLALRGRRPIAHALATFLTLRPFEFIRTDVGIPNLPVTLVGAVPGVLSEANGPTHQSLEDVAIMRGIPNMRVFCPADLDDLLAGLPALLDDPAPCYIRYNDRPAVTRHGPFEVGKAEVISRGSDVSIVVYGALFREAFEAAELLREAGLGVHLVNLRMPTPVDEAAILEAARGTRLLVTVEDHFLTGGLYSIVAETLLRHRTTAHVLPIAFAGRWFRPALLADVLRTEGLLGPQIAERILAALPRPS
jgi:transketolase